MFQQISAQLNSLDQQLAPSAFKTPENALFNNPDYKENAQCKPFGADSEKKVSNEDIKTLEAKIKVLTTQINSISSLKQTDSEFFSPIKARRLHQSGIKKQSTLKKRSRLEMANQQQQCRRDFEEDIVVGVSDQEMASPEKPKQPSSCFEDVNIEHLTRFQSVSSHPEQ